MGSEDVDAPAELMLMLAAMGQEGRRELASEFRRECEHRHRNARAPGAVHNSDLPARATVLVLSMLVLILSGALCWMTTLAPVFGR